MKKYLLSTGRSSDSVDTYIIDLIKLYLNVYPGDIPNSDIGFNFIFTNTLKSDLALDVKYRVEELVTKIQKQFKTSNVQISIDSVDIIDEKLAKITLTVNKTKEDIEVSLNNE